MTKNEKISGKYYFKLKENLLAKDWIHHWFILKNVLKPKFELTEEQDNNKNYLNVTGKHNGLLLLKKAPICIKRNPELNTFTGIWMYTKYENKITKLLEEYIRLYLTYSKLNIEVIEITQFQ